MWHILIAVGTLVCAIQAIRSNRLLVSAFWLAGTSALVALEMYLLGAPEVAVVELSVGAGLITVLFVFAINLTGEEKIEARSLIPRPLYWVAHLLMLGLLAWLIIPLIDKASINSTAATFQSVFWSERRLDLWVQIALIFTGVLGVLGLLSERVSLQKPAPAKNEEEKA